MCKRLAAQQHASSKAILYTGDCEPLRGTVVQRLAMTLCCMLKRGAAGAGAHAGPQAPAGYSWSSLILLPFQHALSKAPQALPAMQTADGRVCIAQTELLTAVFARLGSWERARHVAAAEQRRVCRAPPPCEVPLAPLPMPSPPLPLQ